MSKAPSTDLFDLIKSLTKPEKRRFKLFAQRHSLAGKNKYVSLFDAIDRQQTYDETALRRQHPQLRSADLRSMKPYLHDLILRSLRDALKERTNAATAQYQIDKVEILMHKGLYTQAARMLARAKTFAADNLHRVKMLELLFLESELKVRIPEYDSLEYHEGIHRQQIEVLGKLRENVNYYDLFMRAHYLQLATFDPRNEEEWSRFHAIKESPLLTDESRPTTMFARMQFYEINRRLCQMMSDFHGELGYLLKNIAFLNANPDFRELRWYEYIFYLLGALDLLSYLRRDDEFAHYHAVVKSLREQTTRFRANVEFTICFAEFLHDVRNCRFDAAYALVPSLVEFFEERPPLIESAWYHEVLGAILTLAIITENAAEARRVAGLMINNRESYRSDRYVEQTKLLSMITYFDAGDVEATESAVRGMYRFLKRKKKVSEFEETLLQFLRKLPGISDRTLMRAAFAELHDALAALRDTPEGRMRLRQFDFLTWLQAKIQGRSFRELFIMHHRSETSDRMNEPVAA